MKAEDKRFRHLGVAGESCPRCGGVIETLLNSEGRDPQRCCWACEIKDIEADNEHHDALVAGLDD